MVQAPVKFYLLGTSCTYTSIIEISSAAKRQKTYKELPEAYYNLVLHIETVNKQLM